MKEFIAACVQIAITSNDVRANIDKGVDWLEKAVRRSPLGKAGTPNAYTAAQRPYVGGSG